jgi:hypothetical protein
MHLLFVTEKMHWLAVAGWCRRFFPGAEGLPVRIPTVAKKEIERQALQCYHPERIKREVFSLLFMIFVFASIFSKSCRDWGVAV